MVPSKVKGTFFLRMAICSRYTQIEDIDVTWNEVKEAGKTVLSKQSSQSIQIKEKNSFVQYYMLL